MVSEYKLVYRKDYDKFVAAVNEEIKNGWQPLGGVPATCYYDAGRDQEEEVYVQAIVK